VPVRAGTHDAIRQRMTLRARDLMETDLLTVDPDTAIVDVHRLFAEEEIHGAPVVDEDFRVCGVVSALDLLRAVGERYNDFEDRMRDVTAGDVMTGAIVSVPPDATAAEIARIMRAQRVHRVLVIDGRDLLGVITTFDLLAAVELAEPIHASQGAA
jgi:CBS domain-containing protein